MSEFPTRCDRRFVFHTRLGVGALSQVFEVTDQFEQVRRALKIATQRGRTQRFKWEYRLLCQLRHPHIVRAYDFGISEDGLPYYSMELVRGLPFHAFAKHAGPRQFTHAAAQILEALCTLHARGTTHGDIKPANILIAGKGASSVARLIDFGLAQPLDSPGKGAGTALYMAPEVELRKNIDGRADLFSLGVTLYEGLLANHDAKNTMEVLQRLRSSPTPVTDIDPRIPKGLSDFVERLCQNDAQERFADAPAALRALMQISGDYAPILPIDVTARNLVRGGATAHRASIVSEVKRIAATALKQQGVGVYLVEGETGFGKTPLMREFSTELNLLGFRVVRSRVTTDWGSPVTDLLRAFSNTVEPNRPTRSEQAHQSGILNWSKALKQRPTALLVDDLHQAEAWALDWLRNLISSTPNTPWLFIGGTDRPLEKPLANDQRTLQVHALTQREVRQLITHRLYGLEIPEPAFQRIATDSHGMPSLVEQTLAALITDGTIQPVNGTYVFVGGRYRAASHDDQNRWSELWQGISGRQQQLVKVSAVWGLDFEISALEKMLADHSGQIGEDVARLAQRGIFTVTSADLDPGFRFVHKKFRQQVYQQMDAIEKQKWHDRAADLLEDFRDRDNTHTRWAEHRLRGSDDSKALDAALQEGDRAYNLDANTQAIEYYARGFVRADRLKDPRAVYLAFQLAQTFEHVGEITRAADWQQILQTIPTATLEQRAQAHLKRAHLFLTLGSIDEAKASYHQARQHIRDGVARGLRRGLLHLQALFLSQQGKHQTALRRVQQLVPKNEERQPDPQTTQINLDVARIAQRCAKDVLALHHAHLALSAARKPRNNTMITAAYTLLGTSLLNLGRFQGAARALSLGLKIANRSGDHLHQAILLRLRGNLRMSLGDFENAHRYFNKSLEHARQSKAIYEESLTLQQLGVLELRRGHLRTGLLALEGAHSLTQGDVQLRLSVLVDLVEGHFVLGTMRKASDFLKKAQRLAKKTDDRRLRAECIIFTHLLRQENSRSKKSRPKPSKVGLHNLSDVSLPTRAAWYRCQILLETNQRAGLRAVTHFSAIAAQQKQWFAHSCFLQAQLLWRRGRKHQAQKFLAQALRHAQRMHLRTLEIDVRAFLAAAYPRSLRGLVFRLRAMEILRDMAASLDASDRRHLIRKSKYQKLKHDFEDAYFFSRGRMKKDDS